ncbi:MoxR family ATPase [Akkermansia muciniphila]|nr:MoxR family ATPase [Akkermansia muciniphila]
MLADEINRASPRPSPPCWKPCRNAASPSWERPMPSLPFFVLATQNPIELEGTFPLPEAQLDRFLFKINVNRTPADVLARIVLNREMGVEPEISPVLNAQELQELMQMARNVAIPEVVADYIGRLVNATHPGESEASGGVKYGASPRAALGLAAAAKARALRHGRAFCSFEDVQAVIHPVLEHRILLNHTARLDGQTPAAVINRLVREIPAQNKPLPDSLAAAKIH